MRSSVRATIRLGMGFGVLFWGRAGAAKRSRGRPFIVFLKPFCREMSG